MGAVKMPVRLVPLRLWAFVAVRARWGPVRTVPAASAPVTADVPAEPVAEVPAIPAPREEDSDSSPLGATPVGRVELFSEPVRRWRPEDPPPRPRLPEGVAVDDGVGTAADGVTVGLRTDGR
jgi:hypothetical protein